MGILQVREECMIEKQSQSEQVLLTKLSLKGKDEDKDVNQEGRERRRGRMYVRGRGNYSGRGRGRYTSDFNNTEEISQRQSVRGRGRGTWHRRGGRRENVQCYNCQKYGHYAVECKNKAMQEDKVYCAEAGDEEESVFLLTHNEEKKSRSMVSRYRCK